MPRKSSDRGKSSSRKKYGPKAGRKVERSMRTDEGGEIALRAFGQEGYES